MVDSHCLADFMLEAADVMTGFSHQLVLAEANKNLPVTVHTQVADVLPKQLV